MLIEKNQITSAEGKDIYGPKENPLPDNEPVVEEDKNDNAGGKDEGVQKDSTTPVEDAPNFEKKTDSPTTSNKNGNEVNLIVFPQLYLFFKLLTILTDFSLHL
jgi:hypothetical protein